jgi:hypothetical protein
MNLTQLTSSEFIKIGKLLKRKETLLARVAKVDQKLAAFESGEPVVAKKTVKKVGKKRTMSPAARAKIAAGQKKRWAKINKGKKVVVKKVRKKMSAEVRANIAAARKAYWAKVKAEKGK